MGSFLTYLTEAKRSGRIKRIRIRIRGGKVQRNIRVSGVKGFRMSHGRLHRMSAKERFARKRGARRAKQKRKAKMGRILMKRRRTMRRRHAMGL